MVPEILSATDWIFCYFGRFFAPLPPPPPLKPPKIKILKKWKKTPSDIIILHKCTITDNLMMYCSWDRKHDRQNFLSFWNVFCCQQPKKINIFEKWKKHLEISSVYTSASIIMMICCTVPEIWHMTDVIIFHFELFFCLLPKKKTIMCTKNYDQMKYCSWDMVHDEWTDGWTEKVTCKGGCPT